MYASHFDLIQFQRSKRERERTENTFRVIVTIYHKIKWWMHMKIIQHHMNNSIYFDIYFFRSKSFYENKIYKKKISVQKINNRISHYLQCNKLYVFFLLFVFVCWFVFPQVWTEHQNTLIVYIINNISNKRCLFCLHSGVYFFHFFFIVSRYNWA